MRKIYEPNRIIFKDFIKNFLKLINNKKKNKRFVVLLIKRNYSKKKLYIYESIKNQRQPKQSLCQKTLIFSKC